MLYIMSINEREKEMPETKTIKFGTTLRAPHGIEALSQQIEGLGYDVLGCGEHVSFHGDTANGLISLSVAAGATTKIQLMSAITLVPLYPAALLAKMGAALDVASNGRFSLGVGVGGEFPNEFAACGVPVNERGARTDDALEVITRTWSGTDVTYDGRARQSGFRDGRRPPCSGRRNTPTAGYPICIRPNSWPRASRKSAAMAKI